MKDYQKLQKCYYNMKLVIILLQFGVRLRLMHAKIQQQV